MGSNSKKTDAKRAAKKRNMGKGRKKKLASKGTTPPFPLDPGK